MKLISMTDFVLKQNKDISLKHTFRNCINYAMFLKQPLELWMFVPCDENGNVLDKPDLSDANGRQYDTNIDEDKAWEKYSKAKERCLFEGFEIRKMEGWNILDFPNNQYSKNFSVFEDAFKHWTIEDDLIEFDLQLTQTAIKQLGL
jgi:hypothetical protein